MNSTTNSYIKESESPKKLNIKNVFTNNYFTENERDS